MRILSRLAVFAIALVLPAAAQAGSLRFDTPVQLPHGNPDQHPFLQGGEPSVAFDPTGDGHVYMTAPQGIPAVLGAVTGISDNIQGIAYWASSDHGKTWAQSGITGTLTGGGDSDVEVLADHTVLAADLEALDAAICTSKDFGVSFPDCKSGITTNHQGPDNDREWLTRGTKPGEVYLTYHDFVGGYPIIERSTDGGKSFLPCGLIIDPLGPAAANYTPTGGTLVSKPVIDSDGTIYVEFTTPDTIALPVGAALNHLYMAVAKGGCTPTTIFKDHVIYENPGADLGKIFQQAAMDASGRLYVTAAGQVTAGRSASRLFMFTSSDHGVTWSPPIQVSPDELKANVFPAVTGGAHAGEALVGWFGTSDSGDPNGAKNQWRFYAAATYDGGQTFNVARVTADPIHYGDICTAGLFCGLIPGAPSNRNLADFASAAIDPADGCGLLAIPGDPYNRPDLPDGKNNSFSSTYAARQLDPGTCFTAANSGRAASVVGSSSGGGCLDRAAPQTHPKRATLRASRSGVSLRGSASDRGCLAKGLGKVVRVQVGLARVSGTKCRYLRADGSLRKASDCGKPIYLTARGTTSWSYRFRHRLAPGRYVAWVHGVDDAGNAERLIRKRNLLRFRIR